MIKHRSWPACLEGKDVQAVAEPGSGKTLAYLLPSIPLMLKHQVAHHDAEGPADCPITLVLAPTRYGRKPLCSWTDHYFICILSESSVIVLFLSDLSSTGSLHSRYRRQQGL